MCIKEEERKKEGERHTFSVFDKRERERLWGFRREKERATSDEGSTADKRRYTMVVCE